MTPAQGPPPVSTFQTRATPGLTSASFTQALAALGATEAITVPS
jgi:hypothetical protein